MAWKTILPGKELPDPREDVKTAVSFGSFRLSEKAAYLPGREYLPLSEVRQAKIYSSRLNTSGCCGLGLPVWYVLLYCGADKPVKLLTETQDRAEEALRRITSRYPDIEVLP